MDIRNDNFTNLVLPESSGSSGGIFAYICLALFPVGIYSLALLSYFEVLQFGVHLHTVLMMGFICFISLIFARHNAFFAANMFDSSKEEFKLKLKQYIIKHFLTIGKETKSNASFDEFAKGFLTNLRNEQYSSIAAAIFPMLGILGTFISIALSMPNFSSSDTVGLEKEISLLLNGVSTAFYVSIYGIFLAIWWMFFEKFGMSRFNKIINRQKNATTSFFWTKEEIEKRYTEQSLEHFEQIGYIFKHVSNAEFFKELDKSVDKKFKIFTDILATEEKAVKLSTETIKNTMHEITKSQREQVDLAKTYSKMLGAITTLNTNMERISFTFSEQYNRLLDLTNEKSNKLERNMVGFENAIARLNTTLENYSKQAIASQKELQEEFKTQLFEGVANFKQIYAEESASFSNFEDLKDLKDDIKDTFKQTDEVLNKISNQEKVNEQQGE